MLPVSLIRLSNGALRLPETTREVPGPGGPGSIPLALTRLEQVPVSPAAGRLRRQTATRQVPQADEPNLSQPGTDELGEAQSQPCEA